MGHAVDEHVLLPDASYNLKGAERAVVRLYVGVVFGFNRPSSRDCR